MVELLEKIQWGLSLLGVIAITLSSFVLGQKSFVSEKDIRIREATSEQKTKIGWDVLNKYIKDAGERQKLRQQMKAAQKRANQRRKSAQNQPNRKRNPGSKAESNVFREAPTAGLPPNTTVKIVSSDFKMKYANSFQEVMNIAKQAGSRFVKTPEGARPQIIWVNPNTLIQRMGLRPGDILMKVNGRPVSSVQQGRKLYQDLQNERQFLVEVYRMGRKHRFVYKIGE